MITIQEENFYDMFADSLPLQKQNFIDNPLPIPGLQFDLDVTRYKLLQKKGVLVTVTAREGAKLVGYYTAVVEMHPHFATILTGFGDSYVVDREYRGQGIAAKMYQQILKCWKDREVKLGLIGTREPNMLLEQDGWIHCEHRYTKLLEA